MITLYSIHDFSYSIQKAGHPYKSVLGKIEAKQILLDNSGELGLDEMLELGEMNGTNGLYLDNGDTIFLKPVSR